MTVFSMTEYDFFIIWQWLTLLGHPVEI